MCAVGEAGLQVSNCWINGVYSCLNPIPPLQCLIFILPFQPWSHFLLISIAQMLSFSLGLFLHLIWVELGFNFVSPFPSRGAACLNTCVCIVLHYFSGRAVQAAQASHCASGVLCGRCWATAEPQRDPVLGRLWEENCGPLNFRFLRLIL